jgi:hypothetical protein
VRLRTSRDGAQASQTVRDTVREGVPFPLRPLAPSKARPCPRTPPTSSRAARRCVSRRGGRSTPRRRRGGSRWRTG